MKDLEKKFKKSAYLLETKVVVAIEEFIKSMGLHPNIDVWVSEDYKSFQVKVTSANTIGE